MLPALRALDDAFAAAAVRRNGQPVTCAKGCSACCRIQAVPVTPVEAYALLVLVERLPEPRRTLVVSRFAASAAQLHAAGLAEGFLEGRRPASDEDAKAQARQYLDLGLACPFLEHDICSIYEARPFACREYFVTTPKEMCADPLVNPVKTVPAILDAGAGESRDGRGVHGEIELYDSTDSCVDLCRWRTGRNWNGFTMATRYLRELSAIYSVPGPAGSGTLKLSLAVMAPCQTRSRISIRRRPSEMHT